VMVLPSDVRGVRIHTAFHLVNRIWLLLSFKLKLTNKPLCTVMACTSHSKKISLNQLRSSLIKTFTSTSVVSSRLGAPRAKKHTLGSAHMSYHPRYQTADEWYKFGRCT
jgi:hypothetical protein